jgi:energy-coupling factor transporter ATP-binding protein EcfA2
MIDRLKIERFKSLVSLPDLELGQVNVFIGANGSGKTALLEAVGMLGAAAAGSVGDKDLSARGVRLGTPDLYRTSLSLDEFDADKSLISLEAERVLHGHSARYAAVLDYHEDAPGVGWVYHDEGLWHDDRPLIRRRRFDSPFSIDDLTYLNGKPPEVKPSAGMADFARRYADLGRPVEDLLGYLVSYAIYTPNTPMLRGTTPDTSQRDPIGLSGGRLPEAIADLLDIANGRLGTLDLDDVLSLLDWVARVDVTEPSRQILSPSVPTTQKVLRFTDTWMAPMRNQISGYDASEGTLYVLFALALALHPRAPLFFAIDNFDQAMHPRLARALTRLFCRLVLESDPPRQVLLTTHNPLVLDGLDLTNDAIRLFAVERGLETAGATDVHRVQVSESVLDAREDGLSLSNLWLMGRLGGVPRL